MQGWSLVIVVVACLFVQEISAKDEIISVRAKRQQCRCVRSTQGSLTCSCLRPQQDAGQTLMIAEQQQQSELAYQLQNMQPVQNHASCTCLQIVFQGNPQYQCQCGDSQKTTMAQTTTTPATFAPTTTTSTTTTTTTQAPTTTRQFQPVATTTKNGQCQCIMIRISGPASAHYQCNCQNTTPSGVSSTTLPTPMPETFPPQTLPPVTPAPSEETIYQPVGTINSTQQGCFCIDPTTQAMQPQCGCTCNCVTLLVSVPSGVCACPQDSYGQPVMTETTTSTFVQETTTMAPVTFPPVQATTTAAFIPQETSSLPLTTTCVMYDIQVSPCVCLPQYDQCATDVCCLKAKFRSHKHNAQLAAAQAGSNEPSTIDMLVNVLQKLKTKLNN